MDVNASFTLFDLYVPVSGKGPTHLSHPEATGILCGNIRYRYGSYTVAGIVPPCVATCLDCQAAAESNR